MRRAARKDGNHREIVDGLRQAGCSVLVMEPRPDTPGSPDCLVGYQGRNILLEIKVHGNDLSDEQDKWHKAWRGDTPWVVESLREALVAVGVIAA